MKRNSRSQKRAYICKKNHKTSSNPKLSDSSHLLLQDNVLSFPIFHHAKSLQCADDVIRVDGHFLRIGKKERKKSRLNFKYTININVYLVCFLKCYAEQLSRANFLDGQTMTVILCSSWWIMCRHKCALKAHQYCKLVLAQINHPIDVLGQAGNCKRSSHILTSSSLSLHARCKSTHSKHESTFFEDFFGTFVINQAT